MRLWFNFDCYLISSHSSSQLFLPLFKHSPLFQREPTSSSSSSSTSTTSRAGNCWPTAVSLWWQQLAPPDWREVAPRNIDNRQRAGADCILRNLERKYSLRDIGSRQLARVELIIIAITLFLNIYLTQRWVTLNILFAWGNISNILLCLCLKVRPETTL